MHPENKLTNHGKQVTSNTQSQIPNVNQQQQQGPAGTLGSKGVGTGNHGVKTNQISPGNSGLKSAGQAGAGGGAMLKTKAKRERAVSMDTGDQRDALTPALEPETKVEGVMRSKRRCVLEKKQPYSGDEWCSGGDTEEEEEKPPTASAHRERVLAGAGSSAVGGSSEQGASPALGCVLGTGLRSDRPAQQVVYVFTTSLANSAADAVLHGRAESILMFHQQNVPRTKLDQCAPAVGKLSSLSGQLSSSSTPPMGTPKSQSGTPRPASVGGAVGAHLQATGTPSSSGHPEAEHPQHQRQGAPSSTGSQQPLPGNGGPPVGGPAGPGQVDATGGIVHPSAGVSPSSSPSVLSAHLQGDSLQRGGNVDGLSKEQLEHRERSLQTLRDIERLLLRTGAGGGPGEPGGPNGNPGTMNNSSNSANNNCNTDGSGGPLEDSEGNNSNCNSSNVLGSGMPPMGGMKKYEEPLQSIISQTQNLGGPGLDEPPMGPHHGLPPHSHHPLSSPSGMDMGPLLGPDGLTPEQMAWRKLQEEYYQEKRRQQEMHPHSHPQHYRMMSEMGMPAGPPVMMRGPPPPYHSKPGDQQWGPGPMMGGGMGGNARMMDMHQEGPRGPRFLGQMQRGPPGGGAFPGSPGGVLGMEGLGSQRPPRAGMGWLEDLPPNIGSVGPFHGCYPPGGAGGPPQHMQGDPERLLTREEMFRIMEKRQLQGLHRLELDRLAKQQQPGGMGGPRMMENPGGPCFPNPSMAGGPGLRGDPMDFPSSRAVMGSPIGGVSGSGGPSMRDLGDSPLGGSMNMNMNMGMGLNPQQQQMLAQKLREGPGAGPLSEMLIPEELSRIRVAQNGRGVPNKGMIPGPDGSLQFPNQGPFPGVQSEGSYLHQPGPEMFGPDQQGPPQMGGTPRLSHMPMNSGLRGSEMDPRHPSDLSINVNPMGSPAMPPPHQLKSPSLSQEPSPLMHSPSAQGLKSPAQNLNTGPTHPPLPAASGAGTPSSTSMKSPQVTGPTSLGLRSPTSSPGRLKSPPMPVASPGWTSSPKTTLPSPGGPPSGKGVGNGGSSSTETGPSLPPRSTNSTPISQPGSLNPSMPFTSSPDVPPSQNPLSLIMSQMSKYAMPSSTPLYHDAIKTIATSDDEMMPDRPLLPGVSMAGNMGNHQSSQMLLSSQSSMGPHSSPQSPMGMVLQGQKQLSHDPSGPMLPSPNPMSMSGMNPTMMGGGGGPPDGMGPCNVSPMHPQNQMGGFPRMQPPSHGPLHSPIGAMGQQYGQPPDDILPPQQMHLLGKGLPHQRPPHPPDSFPSMGMGEGPDLSEVIRPTHSGIPEFDLSRIIPADKPSSTLQYFPKSEAMSQTQQNLHQGPGSQHPPPAQLLKQLSSSSGPPHSGAPSSNPHIANLQNMMAEQQLPLHPSHCGMRSGMGGPQGGARGMVVGGGGLGPMCHPGHMMVGRTGMGPQQQQHHQQQQAMMANNLLHHPSHPHPSMMSPQQHSHNLMAQQNLMMMQAKQRGLAISGEHFGQQGPLMSPQGPVMGPPHPQTGMMGPQAHRQRGMSLDSPLGYGPGSMANMPF
ncbi:B-cell CLL/lymphoma 9-like protein [Denticeps clupeoides]|uniref:B-cell lymphoma 9 beta-catenin binding domain-containing protein n=1 Tax=Denticeps clupeoides TaxID=299321 RepID=A0AAY4E1U8_9TELE|nr:B-cell CLL/lymphoma 9-like protein [Denticeps clupeoides]